MTVFEKVSEARFVADGGEAVCYSDIKKPERATSGSAGYDFFAPCDITVSPRESVKVATGLRCRMDKDRCLLILPRSSLGFKFKLSLDNTVGVIDSDYYYAENEGHILVKMTNRSDKTLFIEKGKAFAQGIFIVYGLTDDDNALSTRRGGFGSTDRA